MDMKAAAQRVKKKVTDTADEYIKAGKDLASIPGRLSAPGGLEINHEQGRLGRQKYSGAGVYARLKK